MQFFFKFLALGLLLLSVTPAGAATKVWIDTDVAIGAPWREVDDAYALLLAFHSPELQIVGLSTTYGNAGLPRTTQVARELAGLLRPAVTVFPGAASNRDLEKRSAASEALADALRRQRLTYLALGPLTNLAAFLHLHPELASHIDRVIFVGGQSHAGELTVGATRRLRIHDANVVKDLAAVQTVLRSRSPLVLVPIEASLSLQVSPADRSAMERAGAAEQFVARRSGFWMTFWNRFLGLNGAPVFDALAVLAAAKPEAVATEPHFAQLSSAGELIANGRGRPIRFCARIRPEATDIMRRRLAAAGATR